MARATATYTAAYTAGAATKAYYQALSDGLVTAGLVRTADTGQVNWAGSTDGSGYEVFAFSDALQATAPIYVKVRQVTGGQATGGGTYVTAGFGTDGAGNLTGATPEVRLINYVSTFARTAYSSHGDGYLTWAIDIDPANTTTADGSTYLVVERIRNADGSSSADGLNLWSWQRLTNGTTNTYMGGYVRTREAVAQPALDWDTRMSVPNLINVTSLFAGATSQGYPAMTADLTRVRGASKALLGGFPGDWPRGSEVQISHYGAAMAFRAYTGTATFPVAYASGGAAVSFKNFCPILRWE